MTSSALVKRCALPKSLILAVNLHMNGNMPYCLYTYGTSQQAIYCVEVSNTTLLARPLQQSQDTPHLQNVYYVIYKQQQLPQQLIQLQQENSKNTKAIV
jgi:hypothetical protein